MFGDQAVEEDHRLAEMERDQERAAGLRPPRRRTYADERAMIREQEARDEEFARRLMADMNVDDIDDDDDLNAQFPFHRHFIHQQHHHRPMPGDFIFAAAAARNNHPFAPIDRDRDPPVRNNHEHDAPAAGGGGGRPPFPPLPWAPAAPVRRDRVGGGIIDRNRDFNQDMRGGRPARAGGANARMHW